MQTEQLFRSLAWAVFPLALLFSCAGEESAKRPVTPVSVVSAQPSSLEDPVTFSGGIIACTQVNVAFKSGGYVESVLQVTAAGGGRRNVQEGDRVEKGAVLARVPRRSPSSWPSRRSTSGTTVEIIARGRI